MNRVFNVSKEHPPKPGLTISSSAGINSETNITWFSLGAETDISGEIYDRPVIYIGLGGKGEFIMGESFKSAGFQPGDILVLNPGFLCGSATEDGFVYAEIMPKEAIKMNKIIKSGEVFGLRELVPYEKGSIVNMDIASNDAMKFVVMSFDEGTGLSPHRAPGDVLVFALEGKAVIGYEGKNYDIKAGETFRFDKNGLHSVTADGQFKMALLLTLK